MISKHVKYITVFIIAGFWALSMINLLFKYYYS